MSFNTYLSLRVGYFNEFDTCTENEVKNTKQSIDSMYLDLSIGTNYNNSNFGYGENIK